MKRYWYSSEPPSSLRVIYFFWFLCVLVGGLCIYWSWTFEASLLARSISVFVAISNIIWILSRVFKSRWLVFWEQAKLVRELERIREEGAQVFLADGEVLVIESATTQLTLPKTSVPLVSPTLLPVRKGTSFQPCPEQVAHLVQLFRMCAALVVPFYASLALSESQPDAMDDRLVTWGIVSLFFAFFDFAWPALRGRAARRSAISMG